MRRSTGIPRVFMAMTVAFAATACGKTDNDGGGNDSGTALDAGSDGDTEDSGVDGDTEDSGGDGDTDGTRPDGDTEGSGETTDCEEFPDLDTFPTVTEKAKTKWDEERETQRIFYTGGDDGTAYSAYSIIKITAFEDHTSYPEESGAVIDLSAVGRNEGDGFLVRIGIDCDERGHLCSRWFWAYEGTATVSSIDWSEPEGSTFAGSLTDVLFREVTLDADELPIPVPEGCVFRLSRCAWDHTATSAAGAGGGGGGGGV